MVKLYIHVYTNWKIGLSWSLSQIATFWEWKPLLLLSLRCFFSPSPFINSTTETHLIKHPTTIDIWYIYTLYILIYIYTYKWRQWFAWSHQNPRVPPPQMPSPPQKTRPSKGTTAAFSAPNNKALFPGGWHWGVVETFMIMKLLVNWSSQSQSAYGRNPFQKRWPPTKIQFTPIYTLDSFPGQSFVYRIWRVLTSGGVK